MIRPEHKPDMRHDVDDSEVMLSLRVGTAGFVLALPEGGIIADVNPSLADVCLTKITQLGHHDRAPRPHDWENLFSFLRPGEELLWIVDYDKHRAEDGAQVEIHLGLKFNKSTISSPDEVSARRKRFRALVSQFKRQAFVESNTEDVDGHSVRRLLAEPRLTHAVGIVGTPSPKAFEKERAHAERDPDARVFQSLNDVVESCLHLEKFRIVFSVAALSDDFLQSELRHAADQRDAVHAFTKVQMTNMEQQQESVATQSGKSTSTGGNRAERDMAWRGLWEKVRSLWSQRREGDAQWRKLAAQRNWSDSTSESTTRSKSTTSGATAAWERISSQATLIEETLGRYVEQLYEARGTGGFLGGCIVLASSADDAGLVAKSVRGVLAGARTKDQPLSEFQIDGDMAAVMTSNMSLFDLIAPAPKVLSNAQACQFLLLPEAELPGLRMSRSVFLGRNARPERVRSDDLSLGPFAFSDRTVGESSILLPADDLFRHVLVAGTTGSGKTRRVVQLLEESSRLGDDLRVVVFETAKRTYRDILRRGGRQPRVYTLGDSTANPLRINPFFFDPRTSLKRHIATLAGALSELLPMEAMIGPKLRQAIEDVYQRAGFDIETGDRPASGTSFPNVVDLVRAVQRVAGTLRYGAEVNANYLGALEARASVFVDSTYQDLFNHDGNKPIDQLFGDETIIEFDALPPSDLHVPAFVISLLLERIRATQMRDVRDGRAKKRWLLVVEEAHNVLPRELEGSQASMRETTAGRLLLERFVRLLQEGRELGIGVVVVDQSPAMLARAVVKNTNTKIVMRLEDGEEMAELGKTLGLPEDNWRDLGILRTGEAIIKASYMAQPVKSSAAMMSEAPIDPVSLEAAPPKYRSLAERWRRLLIGDGPAPNREWLNASLDDANGSLDLVLFSLERELIFLPVKDASSIAWRDEVLDAARRASDSPDHAVEFSEHVYDAARSRAFRLALLPLCRGLVDTLCVGPSIEAERLGHLLPAAATILCELAWPITAADLARIVCGADNDDAWNVLSRLVTYELLSRTRSPARVDVQALLDDLAPLDVTADAWPTLRERLAAHLHLVAAQAQIPADGRKLIHG